MVENKTENDKYRGWEYARTGDYHRNLDLNWGYAPTYLRKMKFVRAFLDETPPSACILDAGCGEGVLVEEYSKKGYTIEGIDMNYASDFVRRGDICEMPYEDGYFDIVLLLDVFEHIGYIDQSRTLQEIKRVLKPDGIFVASIPNLAHLSSRITFSIFGRLQRTDIEINHIGERPYWENHQILLENDFSIERKIGITLTIPIIYWIITHRAAKLRWLHDLFEPLAIPSLAMLTIFFCRSKVTTVSDKT